MWFAKPEWDPMRSKKQLYGKSVAARLAPNVTRGNLIGESIPTAKSGDEVHLYDWCRLRTSCYCSQ